MAEDEQCWTMAAAARFLGVSRAHVSKEVQLGKMGTLTVHGRTYVTAFSVRAYKLARAERQRRRTGPRGQLQV